MRLPRRALQGLKRFSNVIEMKEFEQCEGGREQVYREKLLKHALSLQEMVLVRQGDSTYSLQSWIAKPDDTAPLLIQLAQLEDDIPTSSRAVRQSIKVLLEKLRKKWPQGMTMLGTVLKSINPILGNAIINSSDVFASLKVELFNARTRMDFHSDVLPNLKGQYLGPGGSSDHDSIDRHSLMAKYEEFDAQYQTDLKVAMSPVAQNDPVGYLVNQAKQRTQPMGMMAGAKAFVGFHVDTQMQMPKVLAAIFALWSVQFYLETRDPLSSSDKATMRGPHAVQVLCTLRLLGATKARGDVELENHLAEVSTGEGKSVTLAVTAATLAMYGYNVDCVCYSANLSCRDHEAFAGMFKALGIDQIIRYGTFDSLSEQLITEKHGAIRDQMQAALQGQKPRGKSRTTASRADAPPRRVLLIDEVDVFLEPNFFSGAYRPSLSIAESRVAALMRAIWADPSKNPQELKEFNALKPSMFAQAFGSQQPVIAAGYEWFVQSAAVDMQRAAADFKKKPQVRGIDYELIDGWVWYKQ
jgi:hypothetical protein